MKERVYDSEVHAWFLRYSPEERRRIIDWWESQCPADRARLLDEPTPGTSNSPRPASQYDPDARLVMP